MPWNEDWPIGNQSVKTNEAPGQENTTYIQTTARINHYFNESAIYDGMHRQVDMPIVTAPATIAGNLTIFNSNLVGGQGSQLFYRRDGAGSSFAITGRQDPVSATSGSTALIGNMTLHWGTTVAASGTTQNVTFTANTFSAAPYNIQITPVRAASSPGSDNEFWVVTGFTSSGFSIFNKGAHTFSFMWLAIGPATTS